MYKSAVLVRTASVTTADGVRLELGHYRYTTESHRAAVAHREWITHTKYVNGRHVHYSAQCFTGRNLDRIDAEWAACVRAMREAGPVTEEQHSRDPQSCRWLSRRDRHNTPVRTVQTGETTVTAASASQGRDWTGMRRSDFDKDAPLALLDADVVPRRVEAVPDEYGTQPLFGDAPPRRRASRPRKPAAEPTVIADTLF